MVDVEQWPSIFSYRRPNMMSAADLTPCNRLSVTWISHEVTSEWETLYRPAGKWLMRGLQRPVTCARTHPRALLEGRK